MNKRVVFIKCCVDFIAQPFGFTPFMPGPGIGGHCLPVDPYYLIDQAKKHSFQLNCIEEAMKVNQKITKLNYSTTCVYHQYVILVKNRKKLINEFNKKKIQYGFHYPYSINQLKIFKKQFKSLKFKNAEKLAKEGMSIPIDPNLNKKELNLIVNTLNGF